MDVGDRWAKLKDQSRTAVAFVLVVLSVAALFAFANLPAPSSGTTTSTSSSSATETSTCLGCGGSSTTTSSTTTGSATTSTTTTTSTTAGSGIAYVQIDAVQQYGKWELSGVSPGSVISTIQNVRATTGKTLNIIRAAKDIQTPSESIGGGYTLDSWLDALQNAGGGAIVPSLNLDDYTNDQGAGSSTSYCNPNNTNDCGPHFFWETSESLLSLQAVKNSPGGASVFLDSYPTFYRESNGQGPYGPAFTPGGAAQRSQVFANLTAEGWVHIYVKEIGPVYYDAPPAYASADDPAFQGSSPYLIPETKILNAMPTGELKLVYFDRQNKSQNATETALQFFLQLNPGQQAVGLTNMAQQQSAYGYTFVYPLYTYTVFVGTTYTWNANTNLQSDGQPMLQLIESLMGQYG